MSNKFILHNLKSYNKPINNDTCVALCYFNPIGYKNLKENLKIVLDAYKKSNIPCFTIELLYDQQKPFIKKANKIVHADTIMFSKENLWNLLEKIIPDQYSKIIFVDADVKFSNPDWFNLSSEKLESYDIIQPMDIVFRDLIEKKEEYVEIDIESCSYTVAHLIETEGKADASKHHPGYSVGIKRDMFHKINGFFEYGFCGNGDTLFWMAISNFYSMNINDFLSIRKDIAQKYYAYKINVLNYDIKIGSVFDNMSVHLFHGTLKNRRYTEKKQYISNNLLKNNFYHNKDGVLEMLNDKAIYRYLIDRREDENPELQ